MPEDALEYSKLALMIDPSSSHALYEVAKAM